MPRVGHITVPADGGVTLAAINAANREGFVRALGHVFEHSPWVAERAWTARPFDSIDALHTTMMDALQTAPRERLIAFLGAHPELSGQEARAGTLTPDSDSEQSRLGFHALGKEELARMIGLNTLYREKFGFPCLIALRRHQSRATVFAEHESRLDNDVETELSNCIEQVAIITRGRLEKLLGSI